jgi:3-methyladenine DNA glycosylase AlkC
MEPFKNLINAQTVRDCAHHVARVWPVFDRKAFEALALAGLDDLEFKARAEHLCAALEACLPKDFETAAEVLVACLGPPDTGFDREALSPKTTAAGLAGWAVWPLTSFVARNGLASPGPALQALHAMTQRFTAEFAIRPFIAAHPELSFARLHEWAHDPNRHVRRLVSEGSRPRLPWGMRLSALVEDPSPTLPLLRILQDDASDYVRRSVANHLNDIAKDHPDIVVCWVERHLPGATPARTALLRHASRTLVKHGHAPMLKLWGVAKRLRGDVAFKLAKRRVGVGESVELQLRLVSSAARKQKLAIDYAVHHVKANGQTSPKIFKGWGIELAGHETRELSKQHSMKPVTTRTYHAGRHVIELRINGVVEATAVFDLSN